MTGLCFGLLTVVVAVISVRELRTSATYADLVYLSDTLGVQDSHDISMLQQTLPLADRVVRENVCRSDIVNAGLYFVLLNLEVQNSFYDFDRWRGAMESAESYIRHGLTCNPTSGLLWAKLAMVQQAVGGSGLDVAEALRLSAQYNPAEVDAIKARFYVWRRASDLTLGLATDAVRQDVDNVLVYADPDQANELFKNATDEFRKIAETQWNGLPSERRAQISIFN